MTKLQATLIIADNARGIGGAVHSMDVIEHDGRCWLVPKWLYRDDRPTTKPERIVLLDTIPHKRTKDRFVVEVPVPRYLFKGAVPPEEAGQYVVILQPDIELPRPSESMN